MLNSERSALIEKIKAAEHKATEQWNLAIRKCISVINQDKELTEDQKKRIIGSFYK